MVQQNLQNGTRRPDAIEATRDRPLFQPRTDIYETEDKVVLLAEMPGIAVEDVNITLERRILTIQGRKQDTAHTGYRQMYAEYQDGDYERTFTLSEDIDRDSINATKKNGLLILELPKAAAAKAKRIAVKGA